MSDPIKWDDDGRLNLEQQRRRAKELRDAASGMDATALARIRAHHPVAAERLGADAAIKLADAQLVIARELGMLSWPKLKAHIPGLDGARTDIAGTAPAPDG